MRCKFCSALLYEEDSCPGDVTAKYSVALVSEWQRVHRPKSRADRMVDFGYKLNFCPECGRDLREDL